MRPSGRPVSCGPRTAISSTEASILSAIARRNPARALPGRFEYAGNAPAARDIAFSTSSEVAVMYCGESFSPEAGFTACPHGAVPAEREKPMNDVPCEFGRHEIFGLVFCPRAIVEVTTSPTYPLWSMAGLNCFEPDRASGDHCRWLESCLIHLHKSLWKIRFSNERPSLRPRWAWPHGERIGK